MPWKRLLNLRGPAGTNEANAKFAALEAKDTQQDGRLSTLETASSGYGTRLTNVESKNTTQDADIKYVRDRTRTVSSSSPTSAFSEVGVLHFDEVLKQLWVKTMAAGTAGWAQIDLPFRGVVGAQNVDDWKDSNHNGVWDLRDTAAFAAAIGAGSTLPVSEGGGTLEQSSTTNRMTFQTLRLVEGFGGAIWDRARYGYESATWGPWRKRAVAGSQGRLTAVNIDTWHDALKDARWDIWNPADIATLRAAGSTIPYGFTSGQLIHISTSNRMTTQYLVSSEINGGQMWMRTNTGWKENPVDGRFGPWRTFSFGANTPLDSNPLFVNCIGDSQVQGFNNGTGVWPYADSWPGKLQAALGSQVTVRNRGTASATVDEILVKVGARRVMINPSTDIPGAASGSTGVSLSRNVVTSEGREFTWTGTYCDVEVVLKRTSTGAWTISRAADGTPVVDAGWQAFIPTWAKIEREGYGADDTTIVWMGGNNASSDIHGLEDTTADHIVAAYADLVQWLSARRKNFILLGLTTRAQDTTGTLRNDIAKEVNRRLKEMFPGHFFDVQEWLRTDALAEMGITPTAEDIQLVADGTVPRSVLAVGDSTHISKQTAAALGARLAPILTAKGYVALAA